MILISSGLPQSARAGWPVITYISDAISNVKWIQEGLKWAEERWQIILESIVARIGRAILHQMTLDAVKWIDNGFEGNPAFITDTGKFLSDTADKTIGEFLLNDPALSFLCDPFKIQIKLSLGLQYRPFEDTIKCSFTGALGNVNNAMNSFLAGDFINGGGWDSWLQISTQPQNNQMGAMIMAQAELDARLSGNKEIQLQEANWGGGFLALNECEDPVTKKKTYGMNTRDVAENPAILQSEMDALGSKIPTSPSSDTSMSAADRASLTDFSVTNSSNDPSELSNINTNITSPRSLPNLQVARISSKPKCKTTTPGKALADKLNWFDSSDIRQIELAKDIDAITNALLNYAVKSVVDLGKGLLARGTEKGDSSYKSMLTDYQKSVKVASASVNQTLKNNNAKMQAAITQAQKRTLAEDSRAKLSSSPVIVPGYDTFGTIGGTGPGSGGGAGSDTGPSGVINGWIALEQNFLASQVSIFNFLDIIEKAFASSTCTTVMKSDVIDQIQGSSTDKTIAGTLQWNKVDIGFASTTSNVLINAWTAGLTALQSVSADDTVAVTAITRNLTSPPLPTRHTVTDVNYYTVGTNGVGDGLIFTAIKNWVTGKLNATTGVCSFDTSFNRSSLAPWGIQ